MKPLADNDKWYAAVHKQRKIFVHCHSEVLLRLQWSPRMKLVGNLFKVNNGVRLIIQVHICLHYIINIFKENWKLCGKFWMKPKCIKVQK